MTRFRDCTAQFLPWHSTFPPTTSPFLTLSQQTCQMSPWCSSELGYWHTPGSCWGVRARYWSQADVRGSRCGPLHWRVEGVVSWWHHVNRWTHIFQGPWTGVISQSYHQQSCLTIGMMLETSPCTHLAHSTTTSEVKSYSIFSSLDSNVWSSNFHNGAASGLSVCTVSSISHTMSWM